MSKKRLDVLLVERNLAETREKAKRLIMAGLVFSEHIRLDKPGQKVASDLPLTVKGKPFPYVSRGGLKLEEALQTFQLSIHDRIMIDVGSSTGGFTDCALQNGVSLVYAIDVGYNQLDWKLRQDERVVVMERTNFRYVTRDMLTKGMPSFATVDVSFISLTLILPVLKQVLADNSDVVILIKPQFEAGKDQVGKKGIVRDYRVHNAVLTKILTFAIEEQFQVYGLTYSPVTGNEGNIEFLAHLGWNQQQDKQLFDLNDIKDIVNEAHNKLGLPS